MFSRKIHPAHPRQSQIVQSGAAGGPALLVNPGPKMMLGEMLLGLEDRRVYYEIYGQHQFTCRFPVAVAGVDLHAPPQ